MSRDSIEYMKYAVREIQNVKLVHVRDLSHVVHAAVGKALLYDIISDIIGATIKLSALFKH